METIILVLVVLFLLGMFKIGYSCGFIKLLVSLASTIIAVILSLILVGPTEEFIKGTPVYDTVKKQMTNYVSERIEDSVEASSLEIQKEAIDDLNLPSVIKDKLEKEYTTDNIIKLETDTLSEYVATSLADILVRAVAVIALYIIIKILLTVLCVGLNLVSKLPVINGVNKYLGGAVGLAEAVIILWILCFILTAFSGTSSGAKILEAVSSNEILNFIYSNNMIMKFLL